ncbi:MAG TPA: DoxX family protein [Gammaproteobacteria bacterium]|nr:DoxX family protein [Gammaproteobacteria bacterium]
MERYVNLAGRILLASIFLIAGLNKIGGYAGTQGYMESVGVPGGLLPLVILLEVGGALALIIGWQTRIAAWALAGFTLLAAILFHNDFGNQMQMIMFLKNLSITGGLLIVAANGAGAFSLDARRHAGGHMAGQGA